MTPKRDWKPEFIEVLRETGNVTLAAQHAGQSRNQVHDVRQRSKRFAAQWDDALEEATDLLEAEARRRAFTGIDKPMFFKGEVVGSTKKYSDKLLMFLLEAHDPKFRDGVKVEHPGATDVDGVDKDREKRTMERLGKMERLEKMAALDDEANE